MRSLTIGLITLSTILSAGAALAQGFEVGPGGVRVYPEGRPRVYEERRYYDDRPRDYDRRGRGQCARLRDACENGERGLGNCRRYRETCE